MKKAVLYCTCCGTLSCSLPPEQLGAALKTRSIYRSPAPVSPTRRRNKTGEDILTDPGIAAFISCSRLCDKKEAEAALEQVRAIGAKALVVAACSLSARGREAAISLGKQLPLEWADIREGCAWLHTGPEAVSKAVDAIFMGLSVLEERTRSAQPVPSPESKREQRILVIGGGAAGQSCAATAALMGVETVLVERRGTLGGLLGKIDVLFPYLVSGKNLAAELTRDVTESGVHVRLETSVASITATPGGYTATLKSAAGNEETISVGSVIVATGSTPVLPHGYFRYGNLSGVSSQMELEMALGAVERGDKDPEVLPKQAVFLQCVAARDEKNPYCSAICCPTALKNALRLRALVPDGSVTIAHRNLVTPGIHLERLLRRATSADVRLVSFDPASLPEVLGENSVQGLRLRNALGGEEMTLPADGLVCSTALKPASGSADLISSLGLRTDDVGFASGREPIQPIAPHHAGVYVCGTARWPVTVEQSLEQGRAAAAKAVAYVSTPVMESPRESVSAHAAIPWAVRELMGNAAPKNHTATVRETMCSRCGRCVDACPYAACSLPSEGAMHIDAARCRSCGSCAAVCPCGAAALPGEEFGVLCTRIKEALGGNVL